MGKLAKKVGTEVRVGAFSDTGPELGWMSCNEPKALTSNLRDPSHLTRLTPVVKMGKNQNGLLVQEGTSFRACVV